MNIHNLFEPEPVEYPSLVAAWYTSSLQTQARRSVRHFRPELLLGLNPMQRYLVFISSAQTSKLLAQPTLAQRLRRLDVAATEQTGLFAQLLGDNGGVLAAIYTDTPAPDLFAGWNFSLTQLDRW